MTYLRRMYCVPFLSAAYLFCTNCFLIPMRKNGCVHFAHSNMSRRMEKNYTLHRQKQRLRINWGADQCLCFFYMDSTIPLLSKSKIPASYHLLRLYRPVCVRPGRNPNCWFSHAQAHKRGRRCHRRNLDNLD